MCGKDKTESFPIADELEHVYHEDEQSDVGDIADCLAEAFSENTIEDFGGYDEDCRETIDDLARIGREFLKVDETIVELQHHSIRDFIGEDEKLMQRQSLRCPECAERFNQRSTALAGPKHGHLLMAENSRKNFNSPSFQRKYIVSQNVKDLGKMNLSLLRRRAIVPAAVGLTLKKMTRTVQRMQILRELTQTCWMTSRKLRKRGMNCCTGLITSEKRSLPGWRMNVTMKLPQGSRLFMMLLRTS